MSLLGVGVDVVEVARIRRLIERYDDRFVRRWYTSAEGEWARRTRCPVVALSMILAGKEAVWKCVPRQDREEGVPWRSVEVLPDGLGGRVTVPQGMAPLGTAFHLSVTSEERVVMAVVLAWSANSNDLT